MRFEPISRDRLAGLLAARVDGLPSAEGATRTRVGVDGADAAGPGRLAAELAEQLRARGRPVLTVPTRGFLRPASLRYEYGHRDPDSYRDSWFDEGALWREVFDPLDAGGSGTVLPDLWDPATDRATRSARRALPPGGVLLLHGPMLLGRWFPFDLTVHLHLTPAALRRRTPAGEQWTLPALARYAEEAEPVAAADVVVRLDDPERPAWSG
ncbi:uridine kinase [Streptomyces sp. BBFR102]|uniref:uridine kinase n=1 Tax=Streptomyces sp. BBFR102 TaxID=3448171 RepID=UPI003F53B81F